MKTQLRQTRKTVLVLAAAALAAGSIAMPLQPALAGGAKVRVLN